MRRKKKKGEPLQTVRAPQKPPTARIVEKQKIRNLHYKTLDIPAHEVENYRVCFQMIHA